MDREIWKTLRFAVRSADRVVPRGGRKTVYSDQLIVKMYLWAAWHDRPMCWVCDRANVGGAIRAELPSISQFSRRMRSPRVQAMLLALDKYLTRGARDSPLRIFDGKPLVIARQSRDPTAAVGYATDRFEKGYKLHALASSAGHIVAFDVQPMNVAEVTIAKQMSAAVPENTLVLADANYDSAKLYQKIAARGATLLTPLKGMSAQPQQLTRMGPARRWAIGLWRKSADICKSILRLRTIVERVFAALTTAGGGLTTLPPWVRTIRRVRNWVSAKIAIYHARLNQRLATK